MSFLNSSRDSSITNSQRAGADYLFPPLKKHERPDFLSSFNDTSNRDTNNVQTKNSGGIGAMIKTSQKDFQEQHDDQVPLFARRREESLLEQEEEDRLSREDVLQLRDQLDDTLRQLTQVEHINVDLEHRLEHQARKLNKVQRLADKKLQKSTQACNEALLKVDDWKQKFQTQSKKTEHTQEKLRRVEKELYRMMQRKYDVVPGQRGSVGESKTTLESSLRSAGLPVPQDVRNISINYNTLGNIKNSNNINDSINNNENSGQAGSNQRNSRMMDEQRRANARTKMQNIPCYVHGRVGCPCSAMAYETNVSEGLASLASFLGIEEEENGSTTEGNRNNQRSHLVSGEFRTPDMRPKSHSNLESPGGLSLKGIVS